MNGLGVVASLHLLKKGRLIMAFDMGRQVVGLKTATLLAERPSCIPLSRPRGAKAAGLRFEKALASHLKGCLHGQWFEYEDFNGFGYCQSDIIFSFLPSYLCIIEAKYTFVPGAHAKLANLYIPIISKALKAPCCGVVIVKNLDPRYRRGRLFTSLPAAAESSFNSGYPSLIQWSGQALLRNASSNKKVA